nr:rhomboid family intramembrane serine protease [Veronia nyctiphanis]
MCLGAVALVAQLPDLKPYFIWSRELILNGQWWRILSGNLTHTNAIHLLMNVAGLAVIGWMHREYYRMRELLLLLLCCMAAVGW